MELTDKTRLGAGRLAWMQERMLAALEARFELERCVKRLDDAFSPPVTALEDPRHAPALRGSGIGGRQIDPGDLEQGDLVVGGIHVALDRGCKTRQQRRPQHRLIRRKRLGQPNRVDERFQEVHRLLVWGRSGLRGFGVFFGLGRLLRSWLAQHLH